MSARAEKLEGPHVATIHDETLLLTLHCVLACVLFRCHCHTASGAALLFPPIKFSVTSICSSRYHTCAAFYTFAASARPFLPAFP